MSMVVEPLLALLVEAATKEFFVLRWGIERLGKIRGGWNLFLTLACLIASFLVDPLIFFTFSTIPENNCIVMHYRTAKMIAFLSLIIDLFYATTTIDTNAGKNCFRYLNLMLEALLVLPLPLIMVISTPAQDGVESALNALSIVILVKYLARLIKFVRRIISQTSRLHIYAKAGTNLLINYVTFFLASHATGAFWYILGFRRINDCLDIACRDSKIANCKLYKDCRRGDDLDIFNAFPDWSAWKNFENASACFTSTKFSYGVLNRVPELSSRSFITRYIYSLVWGLQQVSTLAGNQTPSFYVGDILLIMGIVVLGLLLFAFFIGNVQLILEAASRRKLDFFVRRQDIEKYVRYKHLPPDMRRKILAREVEAWEYDEGAKEEAVFASFPFSLQQEIRHFTDCFKKHNVLRHMDDRVLDAIRSSLHWKTFKAKDSLSSSIFICSGEVECIQAGRTQSLSPGNVVVTKLLKLLLDPSDTDSGGCPQEVICRTKVDAYILYDADVQRIGTRYKKQLSSQRIFLALIDDLCIESAEEDAYMFRLLRSVCKDFRQDHHKQGSTFEETNDIVFISSGETTEADDREHACLPNRVFGTVNLKWWCLERVAFEDFNRRRTIRCVKDVVAFTIEESLIRDRIKLFLKTNHLKDDRGAQIFARL